MRNNTKRHQSYISYVGLNRPEHRPPVRIPTVMNYFLFCGTNREDVCDTLTARHYFQ